jgi:predicted Zn-ribbon and HTH transcriptional regulator
MDLTDQTQTNVDTDATANHLGTLSTYELQLFHAIKTNQLPTFMYDEVRSVHPLVFKLIDSGEHCFSDSNVASPSQSHPSKRTRTEVEGFSTPPLRHTARTPINIGAKNNEHTVTYNKFASLNEATLNDTTIQNSQPATPKPIKIKHITIAKTSNFKELLNQIAGPNNDTKFHAKPAGEFIRLFPQTIDDHSKIANYIKENKIAGFLLPMGVVRPVKIVIKGLTKDFSTTEIHDELTELGYPVQKVSQMIRNRDGHVWDLFQVQLTPCEKTQKIFTELEHLFRFPVKIDKYKSPFKTQQCHNCQGYHHHSNYCSMPPRCVKCAGDHPSAQCNRPKNPDPQLPPKCVNCLKSHTANYRGCEAFPHNKIKTARPSTRVINPNISFAQITSPQPSAISRPSKEIQSSSNPTPNSPQNLNSPPDVPVLQDMAGVLSDIQQLLGINDFLDMYKKLTDIRNQLQHINSHENRLFLFFNSVLSLQNKPVTKP